MVCVARALGICAGAVRTKVQLLALGMVLAGGLIAAPAHAAQYTVVGCAGQPASTGGWSGLTSGSHPASIAETCASSGGVMLARLLATQTPAAGTAIWRLNAPANTSVAGVTLSRKVASAGTGYSYVARAVTAAGAVAAIESCATPAACKTLAAKPSVAWAVPRTDLTRLEFYVTCPNTSCQKLASGEAVSVRASRADVTFNDATAPVVTAGPSSAMFGGGAASGVQSITVGFRDVGGGIASTGVQVDGQTVSEVPVSNSSCRTPYRRLVPCPLNVTSTLQFNPASVPDGAHQVRVFARDATGANVGFSQSLPVTTSARGAINGTNGSDQVRVTAGVRRAVESGHRPARARSSMSVAFNTKTVAEGRLVNSAGQPVVGARLSVATAVDRGVPVFADLPNDVVTDSTGRYKVTLPRGPSLVARVQYFARALDTAPAGRALARVKVAAHATFAPRKRHLKRGQRAVFRGHVVGFYRPAGVRVELQGRRRNSYVTLSTAAAGADGTYRVAYRFTHSAHGRFVFRLRIRHFPRFPYYLGYTRPVNVFVR